MSTSYAAPNETGQISLIIPTYNRASLIAETIESALRQTQPFHEIIVVDDGSTDNTAEVLAPYADRISLIRLKNGGVQIARNTGVAAARGEYVALCDSDDLFEDNFVELVGGWLAQNADCDSVYCNFSTFDQTRIYPDKFSFAPAGFFDGAQKSGLFLTNIPDFYLRTMDYQPLFPTGSVFRKTFYEKIGGYNPVFFDVGGEDWEFTLRAIAEGRLALCTQSLTRVRKHVSNDSVDSVRQVRGSADILEYTLTHHPYAARYHDAIVKHIDDRRISVFHVAFAEGKFQVASDMLKHIPTPPGDTKFQLKTFILKQAAPVRQLLWRLTQMLIG